MASRKTAARKANPMPVRPLKLWQDDSSNQDVRIELIPLIDVIFCILTFFILAAVGFTRQQAISLDLPQANTGKPQMREMLVVSLDDLGQVYVEQQQVTRTQLSQSLKNYHQSNPNGLMVLYAAKNATYREVVEVLDLLKEVGGDRVALATLPGESQPQPNFNPSPQSVPGLAPFNPNPAIPNIPEPPAPPSN